MRLISANLNGIRAAESKGFFKWLKSQNISNIEMLKTFNCGVGFCLIIDPKNLHKVKKFFTKESISSGKKEHIHLLILVNQEQENYWSALKKDHLLL